MSVEKIKTYTQQFSNMAHAAQRQYIQSVKQLHPDHFNQVSVLDVGSCDINGNNREFFSLTEYIGVDVHPGHNVDVVSPIHKWETEKTFDVVISTECLEHDMHYADSLSAMISHLKPGGLFVMTCATTGRPEHGTLRTTKKDSMTTLLEDAEWANYYKNLTEQDIREALDIESIFSSYEFSIEHGHKDLYLWGIKND